MLLLMGAAISCMFCFWLQFSPIAFPWDSAIPGDKCQLNVLPAYIILGILSVLIDFFFAVFPWFFMWNLHMNQREKPIILASMSLGIIAGCFGLRRGSEIPRLRAQNYLKNFVGIIIWGAAEMAVTMVCIGIPNLPPSLQEVSRKEDFQRR
ncbi:hypothetical protein ACJZ2D_011241 [Fusarium nematophilum]